MILDYRPLGKALIFSNSIEDKAVDLYVFEKSLLCEKNCEKHFLRSIEKFYQGYMTTSPVSYTHLTLPTILLV